MSEAPRVLSPTVFLSYARADAAFVRRLADALSKRLSPKFQLALDVESVDPGDNIFEEISNAISKADAIVVVVSEASLSSNWVQSEIAYALAQGQLGVPIFPVLIDNPKNVPHLLRSISYIDLSKNEMFEDGVERLAFAIVRRLEAHAPKAKNSPESDPGNFIGLQRELLNQSKANLITVIQEEDIKINRLTIFMIISSLSALACVSALLLLTDQAGHFYVLIANPILALISSVMGYYFGKRASFSNEKIEHLTNSPNRHD